MLAAIHVASLIEAWFGGDDLALCGLGDHYEETGQTANRAIVESAKNLRTASRFFYASSGWSYKPKEETAEEGRLKSAVKMAEMEKWAEDNDIEFTWEEDEDSHDGPYYGCVAGSPKGRTASLWRIDLGPHGPDLRDPSVRVIEAELAWELFDVIKEEQGDGE